MVSNTPHHPAERPRHTHSLLSQERDGDGVTPETQSVLEKKRDARLRGAVDEWRRYKGVFKARSKADMEQYYNRLADEAEEGLKHQNLRSVFCSIRAISDNPAHSHNCNRGDASTHPCDAQ